MLAGVSARVGAPDLSEKDSSLKRPEALPGPCHDFGRSNASAVRSSSERN
jgi:hypothetical protein